MVKKIMITLLCAALILIIADPLAGYFLKRYFPEAPFLLNDYANSVGVDAFWNMVDAGQHPIVFTGSSTTIYGAAPHIFDDELGKLTDSPAASVNVAATGELSTWARDLTTNLFIPRGAAAIFYNAEARAFDPRVSGNVWEASPLGYIFQMPSGIEKTAALWLLQHSAFMRYHNNFHDLLLARRDPVTRIGSYESLDDRGHASSKGIQGTEAMPVPNDWTPLQIQAEYMNAVAEIVTACAASETTCIVVIMPTHRTLFDVIPADEKAQLRLRLYAQVSTGKAALWDFNTAACLDYLGTNAFKDRDHLNDFGSEKFSRMLAVLYAHQYLEKSLPDDVDVDCVDIIH